MRQHAEPEGSRLTAPALDRASLEAEIRRLAPFHHDVQLPFGLRTHLPELARRGSERTRMKSLLAHAWPAILEACGGSLHGKRVLDVGCNCGGFAVQAIRDGADYVLGIDLIDRYVAQALFLKRALGLDRVDFQRMSVEDLDASTTGAFDVVLCFGLLYHFESPFHSMRRLASVTREILVVDTNLASLTIRLHRRPVWQMRRAPRATPDSLDATTSLWRSEDRVQFKPNDAAVEQLLGFVGFGDVRRLPVRRLGLERRYYLGGRATYLATRR